MAATLQIKKAVRRALPLQIAFVGPQNSGKTLSALLFAAGLANGGKVVVIDTEKGRASLYADNKRVMAVMPQGFDVIELDAPYHPNRFVEALDVAEKAGYKVCLIDSSSDSWDGQGGCVDIAEAAKNMWNGAKLANKRLMTRIALSDMHIICCLKAQEKTKIVDKRESASGRQEYISLGMQPICEKNFFFPMTFAWMVDANTHLATAMKMHDDVANFFQEPRLITAADGEVIRKWNESGKAMGAHDQLIKRSRDAAEQGMAKYQEFFSALTVAQKNALKGPVHEENKRTADRAGQIPTFGTADEQEDWPDAFDGPELIWNGKHLRMDEATGSYVEVDQSAQERNAA